MATIDVKDAGGLTKTLQQPNSNGRAAAADSRPIALSTEDLAALTSILSSVDGLETLIAATNALLATQAGYLDGVESGLTALVPLNSGRAAAAASKPFVLSNEDFAALSSILTSVDGLETLIAATNALLTTQNTYLDGVETLLTAIDGHVDGLETLAAAPIAPGEAVIGKVGGSSKVVAAVPGVTAAAYTAGYCLGGKLTFANFARVAGGTGLISMAELFCKSTQTFASDLYLFHTDPATSSFVNNNPFQVAVADFDKLIGKISFPALESIGTPSHAQAFPPAMNYELPAGSQIVYGVLVARGAPTLGSTTDLKVALKGLQD